ncbi:unnamed protein product [Fusarium graminearum]|nr:unnamed protein product [Fusarium graminearum]
MICDVDRTAAKFIDPSFCLKASVQGVFEFFSLGGPFFRLEIEVWAGSSIMQWCPTKNIPRGTRLIFR